MCWFSILFGEASRGVVRAVFRNRKGPSDNKHRHCLGGKGNFLVILCICNYRTQNVQICCNHVPWLHTLAETRCLISPNDSCGFHGAAFTSPEQPVDVSREGIHPQGSAEVLVTETRKRSHARRGTEGPGRSTQLSAPFFLQLCTFTARIASTLSF